MTDARELTLTLKGKWYGGYGIARCPVHDDRDPSLSISFGKDGRTLVKCHAGCEQARVIEALRGLGLWDGAPSNLRSFVPKTDNGNGEHAKRIWEECLPAPGTLVEIYLRSRGITIPIPDVLRFHPGLKHPDGGEWPAMVARVDHHDDHIAIHRTFLRGDGSSKAPMPKPRLMLGRCSGGALRLSEPAEKLAVGEGIETCLSILQATGKSIWAALSTSGLKSAELPEIVHEVLLIEDVDEAGEEAATFAGRKWQQAGLVVKIARPTAGHNDFNDMLKAGGNIIRSVSEARPLPVDIKAIAKTENLIERERLIKKEARRVGVSSESIKAECKRQHNDPTSNIALMQPHWDVEPWHETPHPAVLFNRIKTRLKSHVVMTEHSAIATALWVMFAWVHEVAVHSPILLVSSPEAECGKSTLLALVNYLVRRGILIVEATSGVIYRMIERYSPTLIVDEADSIFKNNLELRGIINSGWTRGTGVPRCHPDTHEPEFFETFGPKVIGLKGLNLPDTTLSRSIVIDLQRKLPEDEAKSFDHTDDADLKELRQQLARFANDYAKRLVGRSPKMPEGFANRLEANWRMLLAIAELCGVDEPAREAAKALSQRADESSLGVELLRDIRDILGGQEKIQSEVLTNKLGQLHDRPWAEMPWTGRPITQMQLARLLKPYRVRPKQMKFDEGGFKGYEAACFEEAWRYLPADPPGKAETPKQSQNSAKKAETGAAPASEKVSAKMAGNGQSFGVSPVLGGRAAPAGDGDPFASLKDPSRITPTPTCAHCGGPAEEGNPVVLTVVSDDHRKIHLHYAGGCRAEWFNQRRERPCTLA
jgi:hypothetical protein